MNGGVGEDDGGGGVETVRLLLENGAVWNSVDGRDETPGCLAARVGEERLYDVVVEAGVRAEVLFARLDEVGYVPLVDDDDEDDDDEEEEEEEGPEDHEREAVVANAAAEGAETMEQAQEPDGDDEAAAAATASAEGEGEEKDDDDNDDGPNARFLSSNLTFTRDRLLDEHANGVMMQWESQIMSRTVDALLLPPAAAAVPPPNNNAATAAAEPPPPFAVLNIGHGLGILDSLLATHPHLPKNAVHHIVEAHPDVLAKLTAPAGFPARHPGVRLHAGRWQDVLPTLVAQDLQFDVIYFDTYAESYRAFREFFGEWVIQLLKPAGRWSFFHGLGADRRVCYDVYTRVVEMDLEEAGFDVEWSVVETKGLGSEWEGVRRRYWCLDAYRLPVCRFVS